MISLLETKSGSHSKMLRPKWAPLLRDSFIFLKWRIQSTSFWPIQQSQMVYKPWRSIRNWQKTQVMEQSWLHKMKKRKFYTELIWWIHQPMTLVILWLDHSECVGSYQLYQSCVVCCWLNQPCETRFCSNGSIKALMQGWRITTKIARANIQMQKLLVGMQQLYHQQLLLV